MHSNTNLLKRLSTLGAQLVATLYERHRPIFHLREAANILGSTTRAAKVVDRLVKNGVVTRLRGGIFQLVPYEMGFEKEYLGNSYVVARELILGGQQGLEEKYYISHGSAFELHQMTTQPQFATYTSSPRMMRNIIILGMEFRFIRCKSNDLFGLTEIWVSKNEKVIASDLERTLIDGLKQPAYCGGMPEVAKAFYIKRDIIVPQKLIDYAIQLNKGAVNRRLGYLMELYNIGDLIHWKFLQTTLSNSYQLLDPELPAEGRHIAKWKLRLNISEEELLIIGKT